MTHHLHLVVERVSREGNVGREVLAWGSVGVGLGEQSRRAGWGHGGAVRGVQC